jgi:imidazolonepropionase-like amidohydrolase
MRGVLGSLALVVVLSPALSPAQPKPPIYERPLVFTHVTLIDATGASPQPDMTIMVSGNRIAALGKGGRLAIPVGAQVVDASNQFMIPGLWDMHTHAFMRKNKILPLLTMDLYIANGVTGIRDMGDQGVRDDFGDFPYFQDFEWRQAISAGAALGPRLVLSGVIVDGPKTIRAGWASVSDASQARQEVLFLRKLDVDFVKVYDQLPRDAYYAIADEATKQGLPFAGQVPLAISAAEASDAGQRSEEHLYGVLFGCSDQEDELRQRVKEGDPMRGALDNVKTLVASYSDSKAAGLFARFVKNGTYQTPTLVRLAGLIDPVPMDDPRVAKYFSPALRTEYEHRVKTAKPEDLAAQRLLYQLELRIVGAMQRSGVRLLAGTDNNFYGSSLHDELAELVKAGLTPMEALQTATRNAAEYLGRSDSGTVEKGKVADLVLLDANPLVSIDNTRKISAVIVNGRLLDRKALDLILAQVEAAANN